jgi:hypothetical protein
MSDVLIIAIITGICSLVGTFSGVVISNKLTCYRIEQLEKKVEKHNTLVERMTIVEVKTSNICDKVSGHEQRLDAIEATH